MTKLDNPILMAKIGAPHGIRGEVRVTSFADDPLAFGDYGPLSDEAGKTYKVQKARPAKNVLVVSFKGINTREQVEGLRGTELFIERDCLPDNTDEDEFYVNDLIGMDVLDEEGVLVGTILGVPNFGAGDLLEIAPLKKNGGFSDKTWYLGFTRENVPEIDFDKWFVKVKPPLEVSERDEDNEGTGDEH
jgi:16S rRNA processing protein RimM